MFRFHLAQTTPVNLILQPIERATLVVWLVAFAQFCHYGFGTTAVLSFAWWLAAPVLMLASMIIAMRSYNSLPLVVGFSSGCMAVANMVTPDISALMLGQDPETIAVGLFSISIFSLLFWLSGRAFLTSKYFTKLQQLIHAGYDENSVREKFQTASFYLSFLIVNIIVVISLVYPTAMAQMNFLVAIVMLFVSGKQLSPAIRGMLLPVYMTMIIIMQLANYTDLEPFRMTFDAVLNSYSIAFFVWAIILWLGHNFIGGYYNRIVPGLKVSTSLWPWYGLLLLTFITVDMAPNSLFVPAYLLLLLGYLLLMLRNTTRALVRWSLVLLLSWMVLVVQSPLNPQEFSWSNIKVFGYYGLQSLFFGFLLLGFNVLWDRYLQRVFSVLGWPNISFRKPVLSVSFLIASLWLVINLVLATGLISGWFDLIREGLYIEITSVFVLLAFIALSVFMNNKVLANLVHFSAVLLLVVLWGINKPVPVYMLFAMMHLLWVIMPVIINSLCARLSMPYPEPIVATAGYWIYISFLAAIISLFNMADNPVFGVDSLMFLSSIAILFFASILLVRRYSYTLWLVFSYLLASALIISFRLMILGHVPVNAYDTAGILVISLMLLLTNRLGYLAAPVISSDTLVKLLPLSALFTLSWQMGSVHSSITLLLLGLFYLLFNQGSRLATYGGVVLINLAVYLWMPMLSNYTNLLLFYIIPVALSVLFITHLHRYEIKPTLQNKLRFISLSLLYIVIAGDVFINETLSIFMLGLLSGLASVIYGISSRTRAFLYTGVSFLVVIIVGQLIVFYPEDRLGRALILMLTGALITATMIGFNIKREMLLAKIRLFRADLDSWH